MTRPLCCPTRLSVEMIKNGEHWESTMRVSLSALASATDRTFVSLPISEALRIERHTGKAIDPTLLLPEEFAKAIREIIGAFAGGGGSQVLDEVRERIIALREDLMAEQADATAESIQVRHLEALAKAACRPWMTSDLRSDRLEHRAFLGLIQDRGEEMLRRELGATASETFIRSRPMWLRCFYLNLWNAFRWVRDGGLGSAKPSKILNDRFDQEYILIGSFFDKTLTKDNKAREADADLRVLLDNARREDLRLHFEDYLAAADERHGWSRH